MIDHPAQFAVMGDGGTCLAVVPQVAADGRIGEATDVVTLTGPLGPNKARQEASHPHHILWDPEGAHLLVPDLGLDRTWVYRLTPAGRLEPNDPPYAPSEPGTGSRHIAFHPNGRRAYLLHEMGNVLSTFAYDPDKGTMRLLQTISMLPSGFQGHSTASEVYVTPSGRYVYASNRGHNSIVVCEVSDRNGMLKALSWTPTQGDHPRHFALSPCGDRLFAENQSSDSIVEFLVNQDTGQLSPTGQVIHTGSPAYVAFLAR